MKVFIKKILSQTKKKVLEFFKVGVANSIPLKNFFKISKKEKKFFGKFLYY